MGILDKYLEEAKRKIEEQKTGGVIENIIILKKDVSVPTTREEFNDLLKKGLAEDIWNAEPVGDEWVISGAETGKRYFFPDKKDGAVGEDEKGNKYILKKVTLSGYSKGNGFGYAVI